MSRETQKQKQMQISRDKPENVGAIEWVAIHTDFHFPEVTDASFNEEFKRVMIEVAGDRLCDYRAAEQLEKHLASCGISCQRLEAEAATEGFSRTYKIKDYIRLQMEVLYGAADQWRGHDPWHIETWPAWMLIRSGSEEESDWRGRWQKAGGRFFEPLIAGRDHDFEESGMIALKTDPIWQRLGDPLLFVDGLGIDHPPFFPKSALSWKAVERIEAQALGLLTTDLPTESIKTQLESHIEHKLAMAAILDRAVQRADENYKGPKR
jgi:hypothetical protein